MEIRGSQTWCDDCTAPEVWPENLQAIELFLSALPAYQIGGGLGGAAVALEGFDRTAVQALFRLTGQPEHQWPALWEALAEMEGEYRAIRAHRAKQEHGRAAASHTPNRR